MIQLRIFLSFCMYCTCVCNNVFPKSCRSKAMLVSAIWRIHPIMSQPIGSQDGRMTWRKVLHINFQMIRLECSFPMVFIWCVHQTNCKPNFQACEFLNLISYLVFVYLYSLSVKILSVKLFRNYIRLIKSAFGCILYAWNWFDFFLFSFIGFSDWSVRSGGKLKLIPVRRGSAKSYLEKFCDFEERLLKNGSYDVETAHDRLKLPHLITWFQTDEAMVMCLSNDSVQVSKHQFIEHQCEINLKWQHIFSVADEFLQKSQKSHNLSAQWNHYICVEENLPSKFQNGAIRYSGRVWIFHAWFYHVQIYNGGTETVDVTTGNGRTWTCVGYAQMIWKINRNINCVYFFPLYINICLISTSVH